MLSLRRIITHSGALSRLATRKAVTKGTQGNFYECRTLSFSNKFWATNGKENSTKAKDNAETKTNEKTKGEKTGDGQKQDGKVKEEAKQDKVVEEPKEKTEVKPEKPKGPTFREKLRTANPILGKVVDFSVYAMEETFPSLKDKSAIRFEKAKEEARKRKEEEERIANLTEEELAKLQDQIPEWKKGAVIAKGEAQEREKMSKRLKGQVTTKFNQTKIAQKLYQTESYKEFLAIKDDIKIFKEDLKDYVNNSTNPAVLATRIVADKVSTDSSTAQAIQAMRVYDPDFDLFELEEDAKNIFEIAYNSFLNGRLDDLQKMCGEMALAYFKVLLKKRSDDKCEPKYKYLWDVQRPDFVGAHVTETKQPLFTFSIQTQEIHCNVSAIDPKKIVDGAPDRLQYNTYNFAIQPHSSPDLELVGHKWEIVEIRQVGNLIALV